MASFRRRLRRDELAPPIPPLSRSIPPPPPSSSSRTIITSSSPSIAGAVFVASAPSRAPTIDAPLATLRMARSTSSLFSTTAAMETDLDSSRRFRSRTGIPRISDALGVRVVAAAGGSETPRAVEVSHASAARVAFARAPAAAAAASLGFAAAFAAFGDVDGAASFRLAPRPPPSPDAALHPSARFRAPASTVSSANAAFASELVTSTRPHRQSPRDSAATCNLNASVFPSSVSRIFSGLLHACTMGASHPLGTDLSCLLKHVQPL